MGFMDKAKKLAEQAQQKLDEAQTQFNQGTGSAGEQQGGGQQFDQHGRPIPQEPPAEAAAPPPAPPPPPPAEPAPDAATDSADAPAPAASEPAEPPPPPPPPPSGGANATPDPFKPLQQ